MKKHYRTTVYKENKKKHNQTQIIKYMNESNSSFINRIYKIVKTNEKLADKGETKTK